MKVLQLGKFYPPDAGGIETTIKNITEGLNARGVRCDVLCANSRREYKEELKDGYKVIRVKSYGKVFSTAISPQMIVKLKEIIDEYDIIHVHHPDPLANIALFLSNPKNQKVIVHYHSDIVKQKTLFKFYKPLLFWMLNKADAIIATSPSYVEGSKILINFSEKVHIIPLGVSKPVYDESKVKKIKEKFERRKIIFSLGRLVHYKGFEYLIESAKYLSNDYVILIGGEGPLKSKLIKMAEKFSKKVYLLGEVDEKDKGSFYKACDVFCLPSTERTEAFGIVIAEAMSLGKPIVATRVPYSGVSWINQNNITGFNVEPRNPKALAEAIQKICEDKELYDKMSNEAIKRYGELLTADNMVNMVLNLYKTLVGSALSKNSKIR